MLGSIYIGLSGMNAYSKGLQTISNNVANLNTSGFKSTSIGFTDLFHSGGAGLAYSADDMASGGSGVRITSPRINFSQGDLRQSGNDLDIAIQGAGFLVLQDEQQTYYARTGQFIVDSDGYLVLQGTDYRLSVLDDDRKAATLNIDDDRTSAPIATTNVRFADNLSSSATSATVSDVVVYDSQGGAQVWTVNFSKAPDGGVPGEWTVAVRDANGAEVGTSTLRFIGSIVDPATAQTTIADSPDGAEPLSVVFDFSDVRSFSAGSASTIRAASTDGQGVGALTTVTITDEGHIELNYTNEQTLDLGAVAIADFRDPQQLDRAGGGLYRNRGAAAPRLLESATDGVGTLVSRQIEASNVDLSAQFGDLILIQRGFQASSQVVSVSNDMIQQLFGIRGQG